MESISTTLTLPVYIELNNEELEKINIKGLKSRLKNECADLYKQYHNVLIDIVNKKITITAVEYLHPYPHPIEGGKKEKIKYRVFKFITTPDYPFRPPEIYVNNLTYLSILKMSGDYEKNMVKKLKGQDCLCCHSLNCNANWSPAIRLNRIIDEIKDTLKFKRDVINLLLAQKIKKRYNIPYAYIEEYLA